MMKRSIGMTAPSIDTVFCGSTFGSGCSELPNASSIEAWSTSSTPSDETSLASGEAVRSGRNAISSVAAPAASTTTRLATSAGPVDQCSRSIRIAQKAYPASIANPPVARLMIPEPR